MTEEKIIQRLDKIIELLSTKSEYYKEHEIMTITASTTETMAKFSSPVKKVWIITSADVYIDFDQKADIGTSFLLTTTEGFRGFELMISEIHAVTSTSTATIKILGLR